jgi:hypothetical protein
MNLSKYNIDVETESKAASDFTPLPEGHYEAIISKTELKKTQSGDGEYLAVTFEVIEGEYENRKAWANLNIANKSATAEKIGRAHLAAICKAVGVYNPNESEELHDKPLVITIRKDAKDPTRTKVTAFASVDGRHAEKPAESEAKPEPKAEPEPEKPVSKKKPWQK